MGDLLRRRAMMQEAAAPPPPSSLLYNWDFKTSLTDTVNGIEAVTNGTNDSSGVYLSQSERYLRLPGAYDRDRTIWVSFADFNPRKGGTNAKNGRVLCASNGTNTSSGASAFIYRSNGTINFYTGSWNTSSISASGKYDYFANSILKMYVDENGIAKVYKDSELFLTSTGSFSSSLNGKDYVFGGTSSDCAADIRITAVQIYDGFVI